MISFEDGGIAIRGVLSQKYIAIDSEGNVESVVSTVLPVLTRFIIKTSVNYKDYCF